MFHCCAEAFGFDEATQCDVFFITLKKSERLFSLTTRTNDYAISPWEFHRESQSLTRDSSGVTLPFLCLGFADYVSHVAEGFCAAVGERPMAIR